MAFLSVGTSLLDQFIKACMNAVRTGVASKLKKSNSALVLKVHDTIQPEIDELKEKIESFVHAQLKSAAQSVQQALLIIVAEGVAIRHDSTCQNLPIWHVEIPTAAKNLLERAQEKASVVFYDKRNIKPVDRLEALKIQLFCTLQLQNNNPQLCLETMELLIKLIVQDVDLKTAVKNRKWSNIPGIGNKDVVDAMKTFYVEFRRVLWMTSSIWSPAADFSSIIATFNEIFLPVDVFSINETSISDGIVLADVQQGRRVLVTNQSYWKLHENADKLVSSQRHKKNNILGIKLPPNSMFQSAFMLTSSNFQDFTVKLDKKVDCLVDYQYNNNGIKLGGAKSIQLAIKSEGQLNAVITEKFDFIKYIGKPNFIRNCKIVRAYQSEENSEKIFVDIEAESPLKQVVFSVRYYQSGKLKFKGVQCHFEMENDHVVRWSDKFQRYVVIEGINGDPTKVAFYNIDQNKNKLYNRYTLDSGVIPFLNKHHLSLTNILFVDESLLCIADPEN